jgi:hypothetical protein
LLALHHAAPYASEYSVELEGGRYLARLEEHYHEPGGLLKPWGYHPGISLFIAGKPGFVEPVPESAPAGVADGEATHYTGRHDSERRPGRPSERT